MNKKQDPNLWDTFTDTEKIVWICEMVMGLEIVSQQEDLRRCRAGTTEPRFAIYTGGQFILRGTDTLTRTWNPLSNMNDAIEAEKMFINANEERKLKYCMYLTSLLQIDDWVMTPDTILKLIQASPQIRSEALFLAVEEDNH